MYSHSIAQKPQTINELMGLEAQQETARHLQVMIDKPCVSFYFSGKAWPEVGNRGNRFYALIMELKRVGLNEEAAREKITRYFNQIPHDILNSQGQDGNPFTLKELESIIKGAYRDNDIKAYGCNSHMWDSTCIGPDMCQFRQQLSNGKTQSREAALNAFFSWLSAKDGKIKLLRDSDVRVYIALNLIEKKRGYKPGSVLFVSWQEISYYSGIARQNIGKSLENLFWNGLIIYQKGQAQTRGTASTIRRVIPVPIPKVS